MSDAKDVFDTKLIGDIVCTNLRSRLMAPGAMEAVIQTIHLGASLRQTLIRCGVPAELIEHAEFLRSPIEDTAKKLRAAIWPDDPPEKVDLNSPDVQITESSP